MASFDAVNRVGIKVKNLTLSVESSSSPIHGKRSVKTIVENINFEVEPGQLVAIIGGSGSGKTTLLNALAGRDGGGMKRHGTVELNGISPQEWVKSGQVAYVQQHDRLLPNLTVRQTLRYAASLRLPDTISSSKKRELVEEIILDLGLKEVADTVIGDDWKKGISGGEKRRVSVGIQLLVNPAVIFLDECTTGLDAFTSHALIETLVALCRKGRTICVSIHQPSTNVFNLFDKVVLLSRGKLVYAGSILNTVPHFTHLGESIPLHQNPADWLIDITTIDNRDTESETKTGLAVGKLVQAWKEMGSNTTSSSSPKETNATAAPITASDSSVAAPSKKRHGASTFTQVLVLSHRTAKNLIHDRLMVWGTILEALIVAIVVGLIFYRLEETEAAIISRKAILYLTSALQPYLVLMFLMYKLSMEMKIFDRERQDNMYSVPSFLMSWFIANLPLQLFSCLIFSSIFYSMVGLRGNSTTDALHHYAIYLAIMVTEQMVTIAFAFASISVFRDFAPASLLANTLYTFYSVSAGFFIPSTIIPDWIGWFKNLSHLSFAYRILTWNEFQDRAFSCPDSPLGPKDPRCDGNNILTTSGLTLNDYKIPFISLAVAFFIYMIITITLLIVWKQPDVSVATKVKSTQISSTTSTATPAVVDNEAEEKKRFSVDVTLKGISVKVIKASTTLRKLQNRKLTAEEVAKPLDSAVSKIPEYNPASELSQQPKNEEEHCIDIISPIPLNETSSLKTILKDITVTFPAGKLSIILGSSGSGKSTLLNILTARTFNSLTRSTKIDISGSVLFNNSKATAGQIQSMCSFVRQDDSHLLPALTARETMQYAALISLPRSISHKEKLAKADQIIKVLGLKDCADTIVGNEVIKGLSGGEKRRLSIGLQMLTDPAILVIDEPTSGLDASTAQKVMIKLKQIADTGRTVICSIHQPRSDLFTLFDHIVLLVRGGKIAYSGAGKTLVGYCQQIGLPMPELSNPSEYALDISSIDLRNAEAESISRSRVATIIEKWNEFGYQYEPAVSPSVISSNNAQEDQLDLGDLETKKRAPLYYVLPILVSRSFTNIRRQFGLMISRVMQVVALGVILTMFFTRLDNGQIYVQARVGVLQQVASVMFVGMLNCIAVFPQEYSLYKFEKLENAYDATGFFVAYSLNEIPFEILASFVFAVILYGFTGLHFTVQTVLMATGAIFCTVNIGESVGIIFCTFVEHVGFSVQVMSALLSIITMLSGFMSVANSTPVVIDRLNYLSPIRYAARVEAVNEFKGLNITCTTTEIQGGFCLYQNGEQVLDLYGFPVGDLWLNFGILFVLTFGYRLAALLVLKLKK